MRPTSLAASLFLASLLSSTGVKAALTVSPSRSQFFEYESVTLICEDGWTVRRNTSRGTRKRCEDGWGEADGSTCNMTFMHPSDTGLYWCESMSGSSSSSSSIQLSVSGGSVILQSPVLPVMEGDDVTLSCRAKNPTHNLPAAFYKDGSFIGDETTGNKILNSVKKSDEGLYKCNVKGHGESPSSRISVKEKPSTTSSPSTPPPSSSSPSSSQFLLYGLSSLSAGVVLVLLVLLVLLVKRHINRKSKDNQEDGEESLTYTDVQIFQRKQQKDKPNGENNPSAVVSTVTTDEVSYGQIIIRETRKRDYKPEPKVVYSTLR
ncbi:high affinity immunoglobulin gamma Fc receptor I-like [Xiphophorus maculatus]|uniref:high affinity immunoglobulin gamma Fc receptor I-like n=1 Tax=Xiphophorus maculatus TaxID=8083 RepID=UPI000C6E6DCD|nr:high affinity immunoglobulin gamma Fc receptor I-like [Xiphophorus maculatus]XP_023201934.1 high affinity immunoglobulin gamma Fc receptor I-like [Xiphophorus maculatus]XP_023201935.1 high affinity immunoglobulin gamma Fc receptor I-like [Xiphophorus maculatus]